MFRSRSMPKPKRTTASRTRLSRPKATKDLDSAARIYLNHMNEPELAVTLVKDSSMEGANLIARLA